LKFLSNGHQLNSRPEVRAIDFWNSKRPTSSVDVSSIFPYGLKTLLEQVDRFAHLDLIDRSVVVVPPEILNGFNLRTNLLESCSVGSICGFLLILLLSSKKRSQCKFK
jgi:hypothetical protein